MACISSPVTLPLRVITRALKQSVPLQCRKPSPFTRLMSSGETVTLPVTAGLVAEMPQGITGALGAWGAAATGWVRLYQRQPPEKL